MPESLQLGAEDFHRVSLDLQDYQPETGALTIRGGKGRKDRIVYASNGSADALADWISLRGSESGALFFPVNKGDRIIPHRMTDQSIYGWFGGQPTTRESLDSRLTIFGERSYPTFSKREPI